MSIFTEAETAYLQGEGLLARLATVGRDGTPHVAPVGMWSVDPATGAIEIRGMSLEATKKFRDVARTPRAAIVVDDVLPPWQPRGVEVRGRAGAVTSPEPLIRVHAERVIGWGLDTTEIGVQNARNVIGTGKEGQR